jgi:multidrug efflux system outer membrane protein
MRDPAAPMSMVAKGQDMTIKAQALLVLGLVPLLLIGCLNLGPQYQRPTTGDDAPAGYRQEVVPGAQVPYDDQWWLIFDKPELNRVLEKVIANNWDLKRAAARVLELRALVQVTRADRYPEVDADWQYRTELRKVDKFDQNGRQRGTSRETFSFYDLALPLFFEVDLWGRLARAEEAVRNDLLEADESRRVVAQTVVAEAIRLYLEIESLERNIDINLQLIANFRRNARFIQRRYERGLAPALELRQARRILAAAEADIPLLRRDRGNRQHQLAVLMGTYPELSPIHRYPEEYYERLPEVPPGLPSELLQRRPDIRAAEARLKAQNARVGQALADRFPRISLTGSFGYTSTSFDRLLRQDSELWTFANGITQPLFDAGRLENRQRAAEARYGQDVADYAQTVLRAFAEVEDALLARREQLERRSRVVVLLAEARATQTVAEKRYVRGLTPYLDVLDAQRARFVAEQDLVQSDLALYVNRINLYLALGGDWADPGPVPDR